MAFAEGVAASVEQGHGAAAHQWREQHMYWYFCHQCVSLKMQMLTDRVSYSENVIQVDFGDSATDHIKHVTPDLQQQNDWSKQVEEQQTIRTEETAAIVVCISLQARRTCDLESVSL